MKKIFSMAVATVMAFSMISPVMAELKIGETNPAVYVNDREIVFDDQLPIIDVSVNRTLVPLRGVFEAMGSEVIWQGEARKVIINSKDNLTRLVLEIGNPIMKVYNAVSLMKYDESEYELESAPVIMNNRTLIPLRAISENMAADVEWDGDNHIVTIKSKEYNKFIDKNTQANKGDDEDYVYSLKDNLLNASISVDKESVEAGEEVAVYLNLSNTDVVGEVGLLGVTSALFYEASKFEFKKAELLMDGEVMEQTLGASNGEFLNNSVKTAIVIIPSKDDEFVKITDSAVLKFTFTSKTGEEGEFKLSDRITKVGSDTGILLGKDGKNNLYDEYQEIYLDVTPIVVK